MLLVVFGAGASFDSDPNPECQPPKESDRNRPPLAHQLFSPRSGFLYAQDRYPECKAIVPFLQHVAEGSSFEQRLERLQEEAKEYPERNRQLAAVRFYLQDMLSTVGNSWYSHLRGVSNYYTLLDQIRRHLGILGEPVCLVTFNYDVLLDTDLHHFGIKFQRISDYTVSREFKLFKVHGSVNWARFVTTAITDVQRLDANGMARALILEASNLEVSDEFFVTNQIPMRPHGNRAVFPAIALPLASKSKFECPATHLTELVTLLPSVTKLLLVGWRGDDQHFLAILRKHLSNRPISCLAVAASDHEASETVRKVQRAGINLGSGTVAHGFTAALVGFQIDDFLKS
jgi:hypothetical protein